MSKTGARGSAGLLCGLAIAGLLGGCTGDMNDLVEFVETTKRQAKSPIEPIPTLRDYEPYAYPAHTRDPFDRAALASEISARARAAAAGIPALDPSRPVEYLENFPLDAMRMVGILSQGDATWALIRTPDKTIHRVKAGNYMGQDFGRITAISESGIDLIEIIPVGAEDYRERAISVALSEE